jgi:small subunit ribosomal protein S18
MAVRREINTKKKVEEETPSEKVVSSRAEQSSDGAIKTKAAPKKKRCHFCQTHTEPHYWDAAALRRYVSDRGRIIGRARHGACAKHQRRIAKEVKYARHLSLLPFMVRV